MIFHNRMLFCITISIYRITKWKEEYVQLIYSFEYDKSQHVKYNTNINH